MTAKAALCKELLNGTVVNIKSGFRLFGITNVPREISRMVEKPFGVIVGRIRRNGKTRYGQACHWIDYRLDRTFYNQDGIKKMKEYIKKQK